jgi:hypothetical protein
MIPSQTRQDVDDSLLEPIVKLGKSILKQAKVCPTSAESRSSRLLLHLSVFLTAEELLRDTSSLTQSPEFPNTGIAVESTKASHTGSVSGSSPQCQPRGSSTTRKPQIARAWLIPTRHLVLRLQLALLVANYARKRQALRNWRHDFNLSSSGNTTTSSSVSSTPGVPW